MEKIKIFTDSAADLPADLVTRLKIGVVPLTIAHDDRVFADGQDLTNAEFYRLLSEADKLPTTSQPAPQAFIDAFRPHLEQGETIISINLSSGLSGTVASATLAQDSLGELAEGRLHIIDSLAASVGQGLLVRLAAELAAEGRGAEEIVLTVQRARQRLMHLFTLDTMDNLVKGGRISRAQAALGELLTIKPVLWLDAEGKIDTLTKVRGRKKSLKYLLDKYQAEADANSYAYLGVCHANCPAEATALRQEMQKVCPNMQMIMGDIGATIGTHTGPGCVGIFYFCKN